ncbi:phosphoglycerate dehydrogenase [Breznakiella homolactica]|uniref:Phosphoglycerate dehydrogenase n=1 Tax=Breznakiella homolactica TaxID=2798577 RepID=A0A7T7XNF9_9SPIR|nr:phosphoglycerate dehydrogenase [Breznakiella homolactica]QQO09579.1 phosphoglycerate dehydrogenase [Breznakiella homolactica]
MKVLISLPWKRDDILRLDEFTKKLEAAGCRVTVSPGTARMTEEELIRAAQGCCAHICGGDAWTSKAMDALPEIRIISRIGVGHETVDIEAARNRGIAVTVTPGAGAQYVAEYAFTALLALSRRLYQNDTQMREGNWSPVIGRSVSGKTLGVVGFGLIGRQLARWAQGFGMKITAYDPKEDPDYARSNQITYLPLEELLRTSDYISLHLPLLPSTRNLIGEKELAMMKKTAVLINTARGGIVDEDALFRALQKKQIEGAALDVFCNEPLREKSRFAALDNILLTPHIAGGTYEGLTSIVEMAVDNVLKIINGETPPGQITPLRRNKE